MVMYLTDIIQGLESTADIPLECWSRFNDCAGTPLLTQIVRFYDGDVGAAMNWFFTRNAAWPGAAPHSYLRPYDLCVAGRQMDVCSFIDYLSGVSSKNQ